MFAAQVERLMLGEVEELWDSAAIAMYPSNVDGDDEFTGLSGFSHSQDGRIGRR